ncbi:MAG TPA: HlyD family secretion protein [Alphaproteobacteria bacterium]|nr:HlyD family secretion protein [Alphaproteobacteria bacterium]
MTSGDIPKTYRRRRRWLRPTLLLLGPLLVLLAGGYVYLTGGRYVGTENAYIKSHMVNISPQVSGQIAEVTVAENQAVAKGDVLLRLDPEPFRIALDQTRAKLAEVHSEIDALKASYRQKQEALRLAQADLAYAEREYRRQARLAKGKVVSESRLDAADHERDTARLKVAALTQELATIAAQLAGSPDLPVEQHPRFQAARAAEQQAELDLRRAVIRAPFPGIASETPEPGAYVRAGNPVMSVIASDDVWIEANFKETELTHVRPGQPVTITVDTYPGHEWHGTVQSISQATGAEFSVLPPQNATGNWVKVVQRVPVRIAVTPQPGQPPLRAGLSTGVEIDTGRSRALPGFVTALIDWADGMLGTAQAAGAQ